MAAPDLPGPMPTPPPRPGAVEAERVVHRPVDFLVALGMRAARELSENMLGTAGSLSVTYDTVSMAMIQAAFRQLALDLERPGGVAVTGPELGLLQFMLGVAEADDGKPTRPSRGGVEPMIEAQVAVALGYTALAARLELDRKLRAYGAPREPLTDHALDTLRRALDLPTPDPDGATRD